MPTPQPITCSLRPARKGASTKGHLPILFYLDLPAEVSGLCRHGGGWACYGARIAPKGMSLQDFEAWEADKIAIAAFREEAAALLAARTKK